MIIKKIICSFFTYVLGPIGVALVIYTIVHKVMCENNRKKCTIQTRAEIVAANRLIEKITGRENLNEYSPYKLYEVIYQFEYSGRIYTKKVVEVCSKFPQIGEETNININHSDPNVCALDESRYWFTRMIIRTYGIVCIGAAIMGLFIR